MKPNPMRCFNLQNTNREKNAMILQYKTYSNAASYNRHNLTRKYILIVHNTGVVKDNF